MFYNNGLLRRLDKIESELEKSDKEQSLDVIITEFATFVKPLVTDENIATKLEGLPYYSFKDFMTDYNLRQKIRQIIDGGD